MADNTCYVGIKQPCGCVVAAVVDDGQYPKDVARRVADELRDGLTVERQTVACARICVAAIVAPKRRSTHNSLLEA